MYEWKEEKNILSSASDKTWQLPSYLCTFIFQPAADLWFSDTLWGSLWQTPGVFLSSWTSVWNFDAWHQAKTLNLYRKAMTNVLGWALVLKSVFCLSYSFFFLCYIKCILQIMQTRQWRLFVTSLQLLGQPVATFLTKKVGNTGQQKSFFTFICIVLLLSLLSLLLSCGAIRADLRFCYSKQCWTELNWIGVDCCPPAHPTPILPLLYHPPHSTRPRKVSIRL